MTKYHEVGVWVAYLPAPTDLLIKNPKLIADPVAIGSEPQGSHGVQEAS